MDILSYIIIFIIGFTCGFVFLSFLIAIPKTNENDDEDQIKFLQKYVKEKKKYKEEQKINKNNDYYD